MGSGRITSWADLAAQLSSKYALTPLAGGAEGAVQLTVAPAKAPITLRPLSSEGQEWIEVVGQIGSVRHVSPTPVLTRNFALPIGGLGVVDGNLLMRQVLPLAGTRVTDLEETLSFIAIAMNEAENK